MAPTVSPATVLAEIQKIIDQDFPGEHAPQMKAFYSRLIAETTRREKTKDDPARNTVALLGDKWSTLVLLALRAGSTRYTTLQRLVSTLSHIGGEVGISERMLTLTLRRLERDGFVDRQSWPTVPPSVEYQLSALGIALHEQIMRLIMWAEANANEILAARERYDASSAG